MKALVYETPKSMAVRDVPIPELGPNDTLVRVKASGVCGTDVHLYNGHLPGAGYPLIPGHEFAGEVAAVGANVTRFKLGDRVTAEPNLACNNCYYCHRNQQNFCENWGAIGVTRAGGMAEYVKVPEANLFHVPDQVTFAEAAMAEPLACVAYGLGRVRPELGSSVLIYGVGAIGLLHLQAVRHGGAGLITAVDVRAERLEQAEALGANQVVHAGLRGEGEVRRLSPRGFDLVIDCTGVPAVVEQGLRQVKKGGTFLVFGVCPEDAAISISPFAVYRNDITIVGSFALRKNIDQALQLLVSGAVKVSPLISDQVPMAELPEGVMRMVRGEARGKVQLVNA